MKKQFGMTDKQIIQKYEKYFSINLVLAKITAIVIAISAGITGLALAIALEEGWLFFVISIGGAVFSLLLYFMMEFFLSSKILKLYYLKAIANKENTIETNKEDVLEEEVEDLPTI